MSDNEGWKPAASADEEKERFSTLLGAFLEEDEDDTTTPTPPKSAPSPSLAAATLDIDSAVERAIARERQSSKTEGALANLTKEVEALKAPKSKKWYEPWTLFS